jgi:hypothetical protein
MERKYLKSILDYCPKTGIFRWRKKISKKTVIGKNAGGIDCAGYIVIGISGKTYYAHRLAFLYMYGYEPKQTDHKDGNRKNNAIKNLRDCTSTQNIFNAKKAKNNTSGHKGVCWHKKAKKWEAYVCHNNKKKYLGLFSHPKDAAQAYLDAVKEREPEYVRKK